MFTTLILQMQYILAQNLGLLYIHLLRKFLGISDPLLPPHFPTSLVRQVEGKRRSSPVGDGGGPEGLDLVLRPDLWTGHRVGPPGTPGARPRRLSPPQSGTFRSPYGSLQIEGFARRLDGVCLEGFLRLRSRSRPGRRVVLEDPPVRGTESGD